MTRDEFIDAAANYGNALGEFTIGKDDTNQIVSDAKDELDALLVITTHMEDKTVEDFADIAGTWSKFAGQYSEQDIMDAVNGKPLCSRQQTLLQDRLKTAEEKSNRESFIGDYTDVAEVNADAQDSVPDIETITYDELMGAKFAELWQPVEGIITEGLTILVGGSKLGKSWICMDMAYCVATGTPYWGRKTSRCPVLYLALEDSQRRLQSRNTKLQHMVQNVPGLEYAISCKTMDEGFEQQISRWLEKHGGKCLVIIDVLQRIRGANKRKDGDAYQADYRNIGNIKAIADRFGAAFVAIHHTSKGKNADPFNNISGSTGIMGVADTTIMITRERKEQTAEVDITGRDVYGDTFTICIDDNMHWNVVDSSAAAMVNYVYDPVVNTVKAILRDNQDGVRIGYDDFRKFGMAEIGTDPAKDGKDLRAKLLRIKDEAAKRDGIIVNLSAKDGKVSTYYKCQGKDVRRSKEYAQPYVELALQCKQSDKPQAADQLNLDP